MPHVPVLLNEVIKYLDPKPGEIILDATVGCGGHSMEILKHILPGGRLVGIEQDAEVLIELESRIKDNEFRDRIVLINGNFADLGELLKKEDIQNVDGVLFDLGMNSLHIDMSGRGFTFQKDEPLAMNFKSVVGPNDLTAREILNKWPKEEIYRILKEYGEEKFARRISENVLRERKGNSINTTFDLVRLVERSVPEFYKRRKIHFATKTFQALRIAVNNELAVLEDGLVGAWNTLNTGGRIVVISFHSLEDRIVKKFFSTKDGEAELLTRKPIAPTEEEMLENHRARSAKLRAILKK